MTEPTDKKPDPVFRKPLQNRTNARCKFALQDAVNRLQASGEVLFRGKVLTQEAVVNLTWLWLQQTPTAEIEARFRSVLPILDAIDKGESPPLHVERVSGLTHIAHQDLTELRLGAERAARRASRPKKGEKERRSDEGEGGAVPTKRRR